ncbi:MAG TPA: PIN domain-containing protein [Candidatus Humimicrobiaceae bacterium]
MKIFLDTNVILDVLIKREPFYIDSSKVLTLVNEKIVSGYISAITINNIYYILRKLKDKETAKNFITEILESFEIISLTKDILSQANKISINDYEDGIQFFSALDCGCDFLITRNDKDYPKLGIKIITPIEFISMDS